MQLHSFLILMLNILFLLCSMNSVALQGDMSEAQSCQGEKGQSARHTSRGKMPFLQGINRDAKCKVQLLMRAEASHKQSLALFI